MYALTEEIELSRLRDCAQIITEGEVREVAGFLCFLLAEEWLV